MEAAIGFLLDPANWQGTAGIPNRLLEHLQIAFLAVLAATAVALPLGFYIGHTGRLQMLGINLANIGRAVPSYAVMMMILPVALAMAPTVGYSPVLGLTFIPIFGAMVLLAIPPILVATFAGIQAVDAEITESSRAMGMTESQILVRTELPLASGVIVGGFRIAVLQVIATATIGAYLSSGGLGRYIIDGIARNDTAMMIAGVVLVSGLAIGIDLLLAWLQRRLTPRGVKVATAGLDADGNLSVGAGPSEATGA